MRSWIPVPGTTTGRLVVAALELFGTQGFASVGVADLAAAAGVTTGSLYHHFGSKAGLYHLVRADVEQRVVDRLEGAAAAQPVRAVADLAPVLVVGFDYLVDRGYARLLAEPPPDAADGDVGPDPIERLIGRLISSDVPVETLVAAAWRAALGHASHGPGPAQEARASLVLILTAGG